MSNADSTDTSLNSAIEHLESGNPHRAREICMEILQTDGNNQKNAQHILALAHRAMGNLEQAKSTLEQLINQEDVNASTLNSYGLVLLDLGKADQAKTVFKNALTLDANFLAAHVNLGHSYSNTGEWENAETCYRFALSSNPNLSDAFINLALLLRSKGQHEAVEALLSEYSTQDSTEPGVFFVKGLLDLDTNKLSSAENWFRRGLTSLPEHVPFLANLGVALARQGNQTEALKYLEQALKIQPENADVNQNLADIIKYDEPELSRLHLERALAVNTRNVEALDLLGFTWLLSDNLPNAIEAFDSALKLDPAFDRAAHHKAVALFLSGDLEPAWRLYVRKYGSTGVKGSPVSKNIPLAKSMKMDEQPILIWTDQGIGDEILQLGMIDDLLTKDSPHCIATSDRLVPIVSRSFPTVDCVAWDELRTQEKNLSEYCQLPAGMLGLNARPDFAHFPDRKAFLRAEPTHTTQLRNKYQSCHPNKVLVGLSWKSINNNWGSQKSVDLPLLMPLLENSEVAFVNLQYGDVGNEIDNLPDNIRDRFVSDKSIDALRDLDSFAAQISAIDLVITISNTTAHMAGALGCPTWVMVPRLGPGWLWYWFKDRSDSPWYPSVEIFRQSQMGDWQDAIAAIEQHLAEFVSKRQRVTTN